MARSEPLKFPSVAGLAGLPITSWFSARGSVVVRGTRTEVFVGGTLIGAFEEEEQLKRNAILVQLSEDPKCHLGRLAEAFGLSTERLRQLRREYEAGGLEALQPGKDGGPRRLSERDMARLSKCFEQGLSASAAHATMKGVSLSTVQRAHRPWRAARDAKPVADVSHGSAVARTIPLPGIEMLPTPASAARDDDEHAPDPLRNSPLVQHAGAWIMMAMLARFGVHDVGLRVRDLRARAVPQARRREVHLRSDLRPRQGRRDGPLRRVEPPQLEEGPRPSPSHLRPRS